MKISVNPFLILRIPAFSFEERIAIIWEDLKVSIQQSSPDFYDKIKAIGAEELAGLDAKVQYTIWKYFNRSKYRGTPYGSFAGFATAVMGYMDEGFIIEKKQHLHIFKDWGAELNMDHKAAMLFHPERIYFANASIYTTPKSIRFLCLQDKLFELAEIERSLFVEELLEKSKDKITFEQLSLFAANEGMEEQVLKRILYSLIQLQLVFTDLDRNIIGKDYHNRIGMSLQSTDQTYIIAERKILSGSINSAKLEVLPESVEYLLSVSSVMENPYLNHFKAAFLQRYEHQEIPLMKVLDPEFGIGYAELENTALVDELVNELIETKKKEELTTSYQQNALTEYLLNAILENKGDRTAIIQLKTNEYRHVSAMKTTKLPANSFSALLRLAGGIIVLEQVGGVTANALAGRFTLASEAIESHCKDIGKFESDVNPGIIFFDMAYMAEGKVDNINRRKAVYDYELPLLNYSCSKNLVHLNDLLVTIKNNEIVLISKRYGKRLVPRLASAYNYNRSDLSVYRFLCDLQHQNIQSQILFDIQSLVPGLNFYPRIQYAHVVLSPAKWKINGRDFKDDNLKAQLDFMQVSRQFTAGDGDQTLCFDRNSEIDMLSFKRYIDQQRDDFMLTEAFIDDQHVVRDTDNKACFTQFLVTLQHSEPLYQPYAPNRFISAENSSAVIIPGKDWLYFEIYCHPQRTDEILNHAIMRFVDQHKTELRCWFFVRYNTPSNHIRLRLQLKNRKKSYLYTSALMELLEGYFDADFITDIQIKTYRRELQRYGHVNIESIEQHFKADSDYCLQVIEQGLTTYERYANCIGLMRIIIKALNFDDEVQLTFVKDMQDSFVAEHHFENHVFKKINKSYKEFLNEINQRVINDVLLRVPQHLLTSFNALVHHSDDALRLTLFTDLFHMHINRLFHCNQRTHELIIYSFLYKQLQREYNIKISV